MKVNYPLGDFLIRIKNAALAGRHDVVVDNTKLIKAVSETLKKEGYLTSYEVTDGILSAKLAYKSKHPVLMDLKLVSKLGLRIYMGADELKSNRGVSFFIVSTPNGVMSSREAIKKGIGGEVIAEIW